MAASPWSGGVVCWSVGVVVMVTVMLLTNNVALSTQASPSSSPIPVDKTYTNQQVQLGGKLSFRNLTLINSVINVTAYNGADPVNTGNLEITAVNVFIDATSVISAKGAGYVGLICQDGQGPTNTSSGGKGGCSVYDSGGGGGHFGSGGPGTKDCTRSGASPCLFPYDYEENCNGTYTGNTNGCNNFTKCWTYSGQNQDGGKRYTHNIYSSLGMGAAGGDKGCRDGDGWPAKGGVLTAGSGGGRVIINVTGTIEIRGNITTRGNRGCGSGNDSGGGGAGGTIILLGNNITIGANAYISSEGGKGGDSHPKAAGDEAYECAGTQTNGLCDDCGGGGGGGFIFVRGTVGNYRARRSLFIATGGIGGLCDICNLRASGEFGWIQFDSDGEVCNGVDDTYDGVVDELQPTLQCGGASCANGNRLYCPSLY